MVLAQLLCISKEALTPYGLRIGRDRNGVLCKPTVRLISTLYYKSKSAELLSAHFPAKPPLCHHSHPEKPSKRPVRPKRPSVPRTRKRSDDVERSRSRSTSTRYVHMSDNQ